MKLFSVSIYKKTVGGWDKTVFNKAFIRYIDKIGFEHGGRYKNAKLTARIFDGENIKAGDLIELGIGDDAPSEKALCIFEVSENFDFSVPHIRITAM